MGCVGCVLTTLRKATWLSLLLHTHLCQSSLTAARISLARASHLSLRMDLPVSPSRPSALLRVHSRPFAFIRVRRHPLLRPFEALKFSFFFTPPSSRSRRYLARRAS